MLFRTGAELLLRLFLFSSRQDLDRAKTFTSSDDLRQTMQAVGVVDKPDIYFLNE